MREKALVALNVLLTRSLEPSRRPWPLYTTPACECECVIKMPGASEKEVPPAAELSPLHRLLVRVCIRRGSATSSVATREDRKLLLDSHSRLGSA